METDLFGAHEVLARRDRRGDLEAEAGEVCIRKGERVKGGSPFGDLEPDGAGTIPRLDVAWGLGEIDGSWTLMVQSVIETKGQRCTSSDSNDVRGGGCAVAADTSRGDARDRGVVHRLAYGVLVAVNVREDVMSRHRTGEAGCEDGKSGELHDGQDLSWVQRAEGERRMKDTK